MKAYVRGYKSRKSANHEVIDYWFSITPQDAMKIPSREWAQGDIRLVRYGITINEDTDHPHLLTGFQIEEFEDGFVISCEGSFFFRGSAAARSEADDTLGTPTRVAALSCSNSFVSQGSIVRESLSRNAAHPALNLRSSH
jgi:hypothetical protein